MAEEFFVPKLGQTVEEVTLIKWLAEDGAKVKQGQEILEVETDKAVFPVEATASGVLHRGPYQEGDVVPVLTVVAIIGKPEDKFQVREGSGAEAKAADEAAQVPEAVAAPAAEPGLETATEGDGRVFASPRARKLAQEKGVDLAKVTPTGGGGVRVAERDVLAYLQAQPKATPVAEKMAAEAGLDLREVSGSGPGGRITREDVERALGPQPAPVTPTPTPPVLAPPSLPEVEILERVPLKGVRGIIAERMGTSVHTTARVTLVMEIDATRFVDMRERLKARVAEDWGFAPGYNDLLAKIVASALRKFPYMNARLTAEAIERVKPINLGMAVDTERGLIVPVVRDADKKSLRQFGTEFRELVERVRGNRIMPDDLSGGTFTLTNLGMYDVDAFTPVINLPEAAILGVGRIAEKAVVRDGHIVARHMWTLSLVFDHRLVDGAPAARFLQYVKELIEEPYLWVAEGQVG
jgi:pyruvate dehydrogenase E2 component (dihydrolipoamide acetyltransferase)